jgi:hypothetical protein
MAEEDFKEKDRKDLKKNTLALGSPGTLITADTVYEDHINELNGTDGQDIYHKMLWSESQIRKLYHAVCNPIKSALWDIEPFDDDPQNIEIASLMQQILFKDLPDGFKAKLDEILTFPWHGHAVFEVIHKNRENKKFGMYTGLDNLAFRDQRTLDRWKFSRSGHLEFVHQLQSGDVEVNVDMPADTLLIFFNERKGDNIGYPFCRMLYGNYKRKLLYKQLQAIGIEKGAIGVPKLTFPKGVEFGTDEYNDAISQLELYTQAESSFFALPNEYELEIEQNNTFDPSKVQVAIKAENEEIAGSLVAMWLEMGIGGNSAVGSSTGISAEFFKDGIEYLADKIADTINLKLIPNLVRLNFGDVEDMPTLSHAGIADEAGEELMKVVTGYVKDGVITPDEQLEDHVRKVHNLPKKMEGEILDNESTQETTPPSDDENTDEDKEEPKEDVELADNGRAKTPRALINSQAVKVSESISSAMVFSSGKYINDVVVRYKQLPENKKQNATNKTKMGGNNNLKKDLKRAFTETSNLAIDMARLEVPTKSTIELSNHDSDMLRMTEKFGDVSTIKLNDFSSLPSYIQVLISKQADLISADSLADLKKRIDFAYSSMETKSSDINVIKQAMEDEANKFIESNQVSTKGVNSTSLMVNEGRNAFFFDDDVLGEIHSFTFVNVAPVSAVCRELAGTTFNTNDAESLRFVPPLHHNCKSYLRANLNTSNGLSNLTVSTLAPSATAKKSITL